MVIFENSNEYTSLGFFFFFVFFFYFVENLPITGNMYRGSYHLESASIVGNRVWSNSGWFAIISKNVLEKEITAGMKLLNIL